MTKCVCGKVTETERTTTVLLRTCRCGLPPRKVTFGAPYLMIHQPNPERAAAGLPDKTDLEKSLDTRWV